MNHAIGYTEENQRRRAEVWRALVVQQTVSGLTIGDVMDAFPYRTGSGALQKGVPA